MAEILKTSGERVAVSPQNGVNFTLDEMKAIVGGWVEVVHLAGGKLLIVNEDGHNLGLPLNADGTDLYKFYPIVGDALLCEREQVR